MGKPRAKTINGVLTVPEEVAARASKRRAYGAIAKKTNLRCGPCGKSFHNLQQKIAHLQGRAHKTVVARAAGPYKCTTCDLSFDLPNEHEEHLRSRTHLRAKARLLE